MVPAAGTICLAPVEDKDLWANTATKANWWKNNNFYGVDLTPLEEVAWKETFSSPVVGYFTSDVLLTTSSDYLVDFRTVTKEGLQRFEMPIEFTIPQAAVVHALGGWFDLHFTSDSNSLAGQATPPPLLEPIAHASDDSPMGEPGAGAETATSSSTASAYGGMHASAPAYQPANVLDPYGVDVTAALSGLTESLSSTYLSTSPYAAPTHWQQVRFLLSEPLAVNKGQKIVGSIEFIANGQR
jgi:type I protein arginine methyltransferase